MSIRARFSVGAVGIWLSLVPRVFAQDADPAIARARPAGATRADFKIVYWYDRKRPLDTFHHQAYDLRKGEFTPGVESWLAMMKRDFPDYAAYARPLALSAQEGENDNYKIGDAVVQEFLVIAAQSGINLGGYVPRSPSSSPTYRAPLSSYPPGSGSFTPRPFRGVGSQSPTSVSPPLTPFPIPYPRPHP